MNSFGPQDILDFYRLAEKLKVTLRHSWLSDSSRQESVAEHSWMMGMLALVLLPKMEQRVDPQKVLKMIVLHDLAEAITLDIPVWQGSTRREEKLAAEKKALDIIFEPLDAETRTDLFSIWQEYEERKSPESLFVKALDTLDVIVQHNVADISTWDDNDFIWQLSPIQNAFFDSDPFLKQVKAKIDEWSIKKADEAGNMHKLDQVELQKRQTKKTKLLPK